MFSHAQEQFLHISDVKSGFSVEDDDAVAVGTDAIEAFDDFVGDLGEPPGSSVVS